MIKRIVNWLFWQFQKRCKHDGADVSVDITEGSARPLEVAFCNRCGAVQICYNHRLIQTALWRTPRATWTGSGR